MSVNFPMQLLSCETLKCPRHNTCTDVKKCKVYLKLNKIYAQTD